MSWRVSKYQFLIDLNVLIQIKHVFDDLCGFKCSREWAGEKMRWLMRYLIQPIYGFSGFIDPLVREWPFALVPVPFFTINGYAMSEQYAIHG